MSMTVERQLSDEIARCMDLAAGQAKLTATNMANTTASTTANIDTPGYRASGMNFEAEMREAINDVDQTRAAQPVHVEAVAGLIARPDSNDVWMDREGLNLAAAQLP